jgi:hypothetical protein
MKTRCVKCSKEGDVPELPFPDYSIRAMCGECVRREREMISVEPPKMNGEKGKTIQL